MRLLATYETRPRWIGLLVRRLRRGGIALLVLLISLVLTLLLTVYVAVNLSKQDQNRFEAAVNDTVDTLSDGIETYLTLLRGVSGLFAGSNDVSRDDFSRYVETLDFKSRYPGIRGIGFAMRVPQARLPQVESAMHRQGVARFKIWPAAPRLEYFPIIYLQPDDDMNRRALGYDMFSEPVRRSAMEEARDLAAPVASGRVSLVQEADPRTPSAGILIYVPVYRGGVPPASVDERREKLIGFAYSPFRMKDMIQGVLAGRVNQRLRMEIYDGQLAEDDLLYQDGFSPDQTSGAAAPASAAMITRQIRVAGRQWVFRFFPDEHFTNPFAPWFVWATAVVGTLVSLLLFAIIQGQVVARAQAEAAADELKAGAAALEQARDQAERARETAESANRTKDEFLAVLSHELRTPLTPVLALAGMNAADASLDSDQRQDWSMVRRNIRLEAKLIEDLLDVTRIARGKIQLDLETVDLHQVLRDAVQVCCADLSEGASDPRLKLELNAAQFLIRADPTRLQQIFWNLLRNAVKFTPPEGRVRILTRDIAESRVRVDVIDSGIGIEPEMLSKIFNAFVQGDRRNFSQFGGLGLGLAIAKGLVEAHGGSIHAHSEGKNRGATFSVELPILHSAPPNTAPVVAPALDAPLSNSAPG